MLGYNTPWVRGFLSLFSRDIKGFTQKQFNAPQFLSIDYVSVQLWRSNCREYVYENRGLGIRVTRGAIHRHSVQR